MVKLELVRSFRISSHCQSIESYEDLGTKNWIVNLHVFLFLSAVT